MCGLKLYLGMLCGEHEGDCVCVLKMYPAMISGECVCINDVFNNG